jgi:hypothetical protein
MDMPVTLAEKYAEIVSKRMTGEEDEPDPSED